MKLSVKLNLTVIQFECRDCLLTMLRRTVLHMHQFCEFTAQNKVTLPMTKSFKAMHS